MSQADDALDRAFSRLCIAAIKSAKLDLGRVGRDQRSAYEFFYGEDSFYPLYRDYLLIQFPGVRMDCILGRDKGDG